MLPTSIKKTTHKSFSASLVITSFIAILLTVATIHSNFYSNNIKSHLHSYLAKNILRSNKQIIQNNKVYNAKKFTDNLLLNVTSAVTIFFIFLILLTPVLLLLHYQIKKRFFKINQVDVSQGLGLINSKILRKKILKDIKKASTNFKLKNYIELAKEKVPITFESLFQNILITGVTSAGKTNSLFEIVDKILEFDNIKLIEVATKDTAITERYINDVNHFIYRPGYRSNYQIDIDILSECKNTSDIKTLSSAIFPKVNGSENGNTRFFKNSEEALLSAIFLTLHEENKLNYEDFFEFLKNYGSDINTLSSKLKIAFDKYGIDMRAYSNNDDSSSNNNTATNVLLGAMSEINKLKTEFKNFKADPFLNDFMSPEKYINGRLSLVLDEENRSVLANDFKLIIGYILKKIKALPDSDNPTFLIVLDEIQNLNDKIDLLQETLAVSRSKGVIFIVSTNSIQSLKEMYKAGWEDIQNATVNKIVLSQSNTKDKEEWMKYFGKVKNKRIKEAVQMRKETSGNLSEEEKLEEVILASELTGLKKGEAYFSTQGYSPSKIHFNLQEKIETYVKFNNGVIRYFNNDIELYGSLNENKDLHYLEEVRADYEVDKDEDETSETKKKEQEWKI